MDDAANTTNTTHTTTDESPFPTNKSFTRWWTARALEHTRVLFGDEHPQTITAHARAITAWGPGRVPTLAGQVNISTLVVAPAPIVETKVSDKLAELMALVAAKGGSQ